MKKLTLVSLFIMFSISLLNAQSVKSATPHDFVNPITYSDTEQNRKDVINYIERYTEKQYSEINMDNPSTLRMMERQNLESFKKLIKAEHTDILKDVIIQYCEIEMCSYDTIHMMYKEEVKASSQQLDW